MRLFRFAAFAAVCIMLAGCASSSTDLAQGVPINWSAERGKRIVLIDPDVELSELTIGGMLEARADWTATGKNFIKAGIAGEMSKKSVDVVAGGEVTEAREVQILKLHSAVGASIMLNSLMGLPTKKNNFDWTLGPGVTALRDRYQGDYALFVYIRDSYSSGSRMALKLVGAAFGVGISGGQQVGFASLVDLRTGRVVWFNRIASSSGSLLSERPAAATVNRLLTELPL
ncbi:MAG TPA: hypothetical protein VJ798_06215 [Rhizomicrobium sp.]|nr:hypothetical protein [Rhizomicrobium sp.]